MRFFLTLWLLQCCCARLFAQQDVPSNTPSESRTLILVAERKDGSAATLEPSDLEIKEDGKDVAIASIRKLARQPIHYCVLFDVSKSEAGRFHIQQNQATALLAQVIQPGIDRGRMVFFNQTARATNETSQPHDLASLIPQVTPIGTTDLYDSMTACAEQMDKTAGPDNSALPLMFVFSDGEDNSSRITREQTATEVLKSRSRIYAFWSGQSGGRGNATLSWFSKLTGGRVLDAASDKEIASAMRRVNDDLAQLNEVVYSAQSQHTDAEHPIQVKARDKHFAVLAPELTH